MARHSRALPPRLLVALTLAALTSAHSVITYPGWRGNNLITNETYPYGMQWMYPCRFSLVALPSQTRTDPPLGQAAAQP